MGISITKRRRADGTLRYRAQVRVIGHEGLSKTFSRRKTAREWAEGEQDRLKKQRPGQIVGLTVNDAIDRYERDVMPSLKSSQHRKKQLAWWSEQIGTVLLTDLTPAKISEVLFRLESAPTRRKRRRSGGTINRYQSALSAVLRIAAKRWHWLPENPAHGVMRHSESRGRLRWLDDDERKRLLDACKRSEWKGLYPLVLLALSTGARRGELLGLTWDRVDLKAGTARLDDTKNTEARTLWIRGPALTALKEWAKVRRLDTRLVFPGVKKVRRAGSATLVFVPYTIERHWREAIHTAELDDFRFHDLRHSAASYLAMNGATLNDIAAILGHKTLAMVKRYSHLSDQHVAGVVERMVTARLGDG